MVCCFRINSSFSPSQKHFNFPSKVHPRGFRFGAIGRSLMASAVLKFSVRVGKRIVNIFSISEAYEKVNSPHVCIYVCMYVCMWEKCEEKQKKNKLHQNKTSLK